jgi:hypothetical protein
MTLQKEPPECTQGETTDPIDPLRKDSPGTCPLLTTSTRWRQIREEEVDLKKKMKMTMLLEEEESLMPVRPEQEPPMQQLAVPCLGNKSPKTGKIIFGASAQCGRETTIDAAKQSSSQAADSSCLQLIAASLADLQTYEV